MRHLVLILGDQLNAGSAAFDGFDPGQDAVWMAEVSEESTHVWTHKARIAIFLSAMRHFAAAQRELGRTVDYTTIEEGCESLGAALESAIARLHPERLIVVEPGEHRVRDLLLAASQSTGVPLEIRDDRHFLCSIDDFRRHAKGRKQLRMEFFYREMRVRHNVLLDAGAAPVGGAWNFDKENRGTFSKKGPGLIQPPLTFAPDAITESVIAAVNARFAHHPGKLEHFDWPVTPVQAEAALDDFIRNRLPLFGEFQDAMWTGEPYLYHARISAALNLKLLDPRVAIRKAEEAFHNGHAPLPAVEGFISQILGWREYVRGVYWLHMPEYLERNHLEAHNELPAWFWTGDTDLNCQREAIQQTLEYGYAHHIQRLMITGLYCLLAGIDPKQVHAWYLAVYVDAVEWVELPNTLGMSQYADGGVMASKPYVASGKYIDRMSNYCKGCVHKPDSCPITAMYWDFLGRHYDRLKNNPRMTMQLNNLIRLRGVS